MRVFFNTFFFFQSMVLVSRVGNVASYLGWTGCLRSGKEEGANMKTGPYGEEGFWSNGRSVSALQRQGKTETRKKIFSLT